MMSTIKKLTIEEVKAMPPLTNEEKKIIIEAKPVESDDCPFMTKELNRMLKIYITSILY